MLVHTLCLLATVQSPRGVVGETAPSLDGVQWVAGVGEEEPFIGGGDVTCLFFFQSWCPGCHSHGFPTLSQLHAQYKDEVTFLAIQTVFEGYASNTPQRGVEAVESFDLDIPVGHDGSRQQRSQVMGRYRSGGTPWTVLIDRRGIVRFNGFRLDVKNGRAIIDTMLAEQAYETLDPKRGGQDLLGTRLDPPSFGASDAPLTLYRWWTDTCPYCDASLPAIDTLRERYAARGLQVVAVYHPKPPSKSISEDEVRAGARDRDFHGDVAIDGDWAQLRSWYLSSGERQATSVSILVDAGGTVRFVHPGPVLFPSEDKEHAQENRDFELLEAAIVSLLGGEETDADDPDDAKDQQQQERPEDDQGD